MDTHEKTPTRPGRSRDQRLQRGAEERQDDGQDSCRQLSRERLAGLAALN